MTSTNAKPCYVVFAGVNGVGKSTFYHSGMWKLEDIPPAMKRVNPDEIALELASNGSQPTGAFVAGREAVTRIENLLCAHESFNQETTLSGRSSLMTIKRAHELGYRVVLFYLGVSSPEIAIDRIAHRVEIGGHHIEADTVRRRFNASLSNFARALPFCDEAFAIDNTNSFTILARWRNGMISWWGNPREKGPWLIEAISNEEVWCGEQV